ncbi:penicillin-binding protein activator [Qipengyuania flava]|uniref:penicillin-binding protein activator n=1 Tax=Qipengyuania flava TaxID=192812 RepID=UPI001C579C59|nr:penicillin-binding protein activator [Qipengyuania flava]MBW3168375.1 penicillin-binding protein activator [Qipengyuania flava]MBY5965613.1 penicillin-binding protein activator [Qipengyuania flava]MBY6011937.1 penicillin-binding protein activator [Qipengyuania flava]MBY6026379.1 penicillin-binding protein activator [Qipengyuania flava]
MKRWTFDRRAMVTVGLAALLGACSVIPKGAERPGPVDTPTPEPTQSLPSDETRHRIALLVPMSGRNGAVGQSIANATTMALLDTNADNLRITTYDTAKGPEAATRQAIAEGNKLILGPLLGSNIASVTAPARAADVPVISFSNDTGAAGPDVFIMGHVPEQSIARTIQYAHTQGSQNFAIIAPDGEYGARAEQAARSAVAAYGGNLVWTERFARGNTSIVSAAERLKAHGGFDTVLIADGARLAAQAARVLKSDGNGATQLLGTELWSGEGSVTRASALRGAWFSAVSDNRYKRFVDSYEARFGSQPYRIATLGYDAVLLTLRVARDWRVGRDFPDGALRNEDGFLGLDGAFRFHRNGLVERAFEVREVRDGSVVVIENAPARF